jgi:phage gpG-like protein
MATKLNFTAKAVAIERNIPKFLGIAAKDAQVHFQKGFDNQGFTDENLQTWKPRKGQIRSLGASVRSRLPNTKKTLTKTGALKRSIRIMNSGSRRIRIVSDLPYSAIHNDGLMGRAWGRHSFKMPKRQFIGNSRILERRTMAKGVAIFQTALLNG